MLIFTFDKSNNNGVNDSEYGVDCSGTHDTKNEQWRNRRLDDSKSEIPNTFSLMSVAIHLL